MKEEESIGKWISMIHRQNHMHIDRELAKYQLGFGQFSFLISLCHEDGLNQEKLTKKLNVDKATTARAMKALEENGYIMRERDPADRRAYRVFLTPKGREIGPWIKEVLKGTTTRLMAGFDPDEREILLVFLKRIFNNINQKKEGGGVGNVQK